MEDSISVTVKKLEATITTLANQVDSLHIEVAEIREENERLNNVLSQGNPNH